MGLDADRAAPVVEEVVRRAGTEPFPRFAHADLELGGAPIARGEMVLVSLEAANHDPARFAEPWRFRPGRPESHLGFGHGPHHCLGAALARAELSAVLPVLARRVPTSAARRRPRRRPLAPRGRRQRSAGPAPSAGERHRWPAADVARDRRHPLGLGVEGDE